MIKQIIFLSTLLICGFCQFTSAQDNVTIVSGQSWICEYSDVVTYTYVVGYETGNEVGDYILEIVAFDGAIVSFTHESDLSECQDPPIVDDHHPHFFELGIPDNCSGTVTVVVVWNDSFSNWVSPLFRVFLELFPPNAPNTTPAADFLYIDVTPDAPQCQCEADFKVIDDCNSDDCEFYFFNTSDAGAGSSIVSSVWKVKDINGGGTQTYSSFNHIYKPSCNGPFEVCLEIINDNGCISEKCLDFDVDCTDCVCVPGPDPCIGISDDIKYSLKNNEDGDATNLRGNGTDSPPSSKMQKEIVVYPNPSNGQFELLAKLPKSTIENSLEIWNTSGKKVYQAKISSGMVRHKIDLNSVPTGIYLLKLSSENKVVFEDKLVVTR